MSQAPYIVLLGDVGSGKSTIIEKITGEKGRSSAASQSATLTAEVFETHDGSLLIADTPGSNSMADQFKHNQHITLALNHGPVTCISIVVKADERIDNVIKNIAKHAKGIPDNFPTEQIVVCVTHKDIVSWSENDLLKEMAEELEMESAVFSSLETAGETLKNNLLVLCSNRQPVEMNINGEKFLSMFDLDSRDTKVLYEARKEVRAFEKMKQDFYLHTQTMDYSTEQQIRLIFEFQQCMLDELMVAQKRLSANNNFDDGNGGPQMASEDGHIASMTHQVNEVLKSITIEAENYLKESQTDFRQCPYCSTIWQNSEGCEGTKTCGNIVPANELSDCGIAEKRYKNMSTYKFTWDSDCETLSIELLDSDDKKRLVCGNSIRWSQMAPAQVPESIMQLLPEHQNQRKSVMNGEQGVLSHVFISFRNQIRRCFRCILRGNSRVSAETPGQCSNACGNTKDSTVVQIGERDMGTMIMNAIHEPILCTIL